MSRYRWLQCEWPFSMQTLAKRMKAKSFQEGLGHGFVIDRVRDDYVEGRYVERLEYTDTVLDPFGNELSFDRVEFKQSQFRLGNSGPGLELINPPRSSQALVNRLSEISDFEIAIEQPVVDLIKWAALIQKEIQTDNVVDVLHLTSIQMTPGVSAKIILKGDRDVREAASSLVGARRYKLERLQLRLSGSYSGSVVLTSAGSAAVNVDDPSGQLVAALRGAVSAANSSKSN